MKFKNAGKYNGDPATLPQKEVAGAVQFKEFEDLKTFAVIMNVAAFFILIALLFLGWLRSGEAPTHLAGVALALCSMVPHEFLHACCFREEVLMYSNLKQGMMFVVGTEDMSRTRFIVMSLMPNLVFGFIPYMIYMIFPELQVLGTLGALGICMGAGDYVNILNCLKQVPKGAKVYMSGIHTYWYRANA